MNFRIKPQRARRARLALMIRWGRLFFLAVGVLAFTYCGSTLFDKWFFQAYQTRRFESALRDSKTSTAAARVDANRSRAESLGIDGVAGSPLGRIEIGSVGLTAMIMDGVDERTLRHAVGHIPGTSLPGQHGNIGLAAHRDTFFRGLRNLHKADEITLTTLGGSSRYLVDSTQVTPPGETNVLDATAADFLTLVTCYPFYFVGPAPRRFIVRAHRISD